MGLFSTHLRHDNSLWKFIRRITDWGIFRRSCLSLWDSSAVPKVAVKKEQLMWLGNTCFENRPRTWRRKSHGTWRELLSYIPLDTWTFSFDLPFVRGFRLFAPFEGSSMLVFEMGQPCLAVVFLISSLAVKLTWDDCVPGRAGGLRLTDLELAKRAGVTIWRELGAWGRGCVWKSCFFFRRAQSSWENSKMLRFRGEFSPSEHLCSVNYLCDV